MPYAVVSSFSNAVKTTVNIGGVDYDLYTFQPGAGEISFAAAGDVDYLIVAGGGGGGSAASVTGSTDPGVGGGGAGGVVGADGAKFSAVGGSYGVTVGSGGQAGTPAQLPGNGGNSFLTGTGAPAAAIGGGPGGYGIANDNSTQADGKAGGSGGGGAAWWKQGAGGAGTAGQGFAGGAARDTYPNANAGGGGGGAGGAGQAAQFNKGGNGGPGVTRSITGAAVAYAGGGCGNFNGTNADIGAVGGTGGGGNLGQNGADGRGGGGGACSPSSTPTAGRGGHGVVILRVATPVANVPGDKTFSLQARAFELEGQPIGLTYGGPQEPEFGEWSGSIVISPILYDSVVVIGASHEAGMFGKNLSTPHATATSLLAAAGHNLPVYGYATGGAVLTDAPSHYNAARAAFPNALIISQFGGNNVSQNRPYPGGQSTIASGLAGLLAVSAGDQRFHPLALTFRDYDDLTFQDPSRGSKPYNENIFIPWIAANFPHALTSYGRPRIDYYRRTLQNFDTWLTPDNVHFTPELGEPAFRAWIVARIADILSGVEPAEIPERIYEAPEEPEFPLAIVNFTGEAFGDEFKAPPNDVFGNSAVVKSDALPDILDVNGASTGLSLSMSYTGNPVAGPTAPGRGANSNGNAGGLPAFAGQLMSADVVGASAYVTQGVTLVLGLAGAVPGASYEIGMVGSRNAADMRNTDVTIAGVTTTWNTSEASPVARYVTVTADAGGNIPIVMKPNGATTYGYLGGLSIRRVS